MVCLTDCIVMFDLLMRGAFLLCLAMRFSYLLLTVQLVCGASPGEEFDSFDFLGVDGDGLDINEEPEDLPVPNEAAGFTESDYFQFLGELTDTLEDKVGGKRGAVQDHPPAKKRSSDNDRRVVMELMLENPTASSSELHAALLSMGWEVSLEGVSGVRKNTRRRGRLSQEVFDLLARGVSSKSAIEQELGIRLTGVTQADLTNWTRIVIAKGEAPIRQLDGCVEMTPNQFQQMFKAMLSFDFRARFGTVRSSLSPWQYRIVMAMHANPEVGEPALVALLEGSGIRDAQIGNFKAKTMMKGKLPICVFKELQALFEQFGMNVVPSKSLIQSACNIVLHNHSADDLQAWFDIVVVTGEAPLQRKNGTGVQMTSAQFQRFLGQWVGITDTPDTD